MKQARMTLCGITTSNLVEVRTETSWPIAFEKLKFVDKRTTVHLRET
jgi:hypothetical protein